MDSECEATLRSEISQFAEHESRINPGENVRGKVEAQVDSENSKKEEMDSKHFSRLKKEPFRDFPS